MKTSSILYQTSLCLIALLSLGSCGNTDSVTDSKESGGTVTEIPAKTPPQQVIDQYNLAQYTFSEDYLNHVVFTLLLDEKLGLMNLNGNWVLPNRYHRMYWHMPDGMVGVGLNDQFGVLNFSGDTVVPFELPGMPVFEGTKDRDGHKKEGLISLRTGDDYNGYTYYFYNFKG